MTFIFIFKLNKKVIGYDKPKFCMTLSNNVCHIYTTSEISISYFKEWEKTHILKFRLQHDFHSYFEINLKNSGT